MRVLKELTIEVIKKCSANCIYCSSLSSIDDKIELRISYIKDVVLFAKQKGCKEICLSGGEPLLKNDIIEIIDFIIANNLKATIYTSGNANFGNLFTYIEENDINSDNLKLIFNYPSSDQTVFSRIRREKDFSVNSLNTLITRSLQYNIGNEVHIVPCNFNINSLYSTISYLKSIGVQKVSLLRLVFQGRAEDKQSLLSFDESKLKYITERVKENLCDDQFNLRVGIPFSNLLNKSLKCTAGYNKLIVKWDGKVYPCEAFKEAPSNESFILGNIYEDKLESIWNKYDDNTELLSLKENSEYNCDSCPAQKLYLYEHSSPRRNVLLH